jgi:hypothetical protein
MGLDLSHWRPEPGAGTIEVVPRFPLSQSQVPQPRNFSTLEPAGYIICHMGNYREL